jgi:hypothetical protein
VNIFFKVFILFFLISEWIKKWSCFQINSILHVEIKSSEKEDREYIRNLITNAWKKINEYQFANPHVSQGFIGVVLNLARMAQCMYQYGDGHGVVHLEIKDRVKSLLINFIKKKEGFVWYNCSWDHFTSLLNIESVASCVKWFDSRCYE